MNSPLNLGALVSESRNPDTINLDEMSSLELATCFNQEDRKVPEAINKVLPQIAQAIDKAAASFKAGGRLIYLGAGTSGRPHTLRDRRIALRHRTGVCHCGHFL